MARSASVNATVSLLLISASRSIIRLTLENVSALPIDFLTLSFEDSTIAPAQEALAEGNLNVFEIYETEYDLIRHQAFSWNQEKEVKVIDPGQKVVVSVACFGKAKWYVYFKFAFSIFHPFPLATVPPSVYRMPMSVRTMDQEPHPRSSIQDS